jgi:hypothetical protein
MSTTKVFSEGIDDVRFGRPIREASRVIAIAAFELGEMTRLGALSRRKYLAI